MDSLGGEHLGSILEVVWAKEERYSSIKSSLPVLLEELVLMERVKRGMTKRAQRLVEQ